MNAILIIGLALLIGYLGGEAAGRVGLPRITGYIFTGILLSPDVLGIVTQGFIDSSGLLVNVLLSVITFSVGGTLAFGEIRRLGKTIGAVALLEAEFAFVVVAAASYYLGRHFLDFSPPVLLAFSAMMGALASPTDPATTIAVMHETRSRGPVSSTIMGAAALDDGFGIINFSIALNVALAAVGHGVLGFASVAEPVVTIAGSVATGVISGLLFMSTARFVRAKMRDEGVLIAVLVGALLFCSGVARALNLDSLLATMMVGITVVNYSPEAEETFSIVERYMEELIFILFFTISGMQLRFSVLFASLPLVVIFVLSRYAGKALGVYSASVLVHAEDKIRKYTTGGLIPQGGIVIGLALVTKQHAALSQFNSLLINIVIGATVIHELVGPIFSRSALRRAGEM